MGRTMKFALLGAAALLGVCLWIGLRSGGSLSPERSDTPLAAQNSPIDPSEAQDPLAATDATTREALADGAAPSGTPTASEELLLTGEVLDAANQPVAGALVVATSVAGLQYNLLDSTLLRQAHVEGRAESDAQGRFRLRVPLRTPIQLEADGGARGLAIAGQRYAGEHVILRLAAACTVLGRVTREQDGAPVADAHVVLVSENPDRGERFERITLRRETHSDAGGYYRFEGLPQASYELSASAPGGGCSTSITVEPKPGSPLESNLQIAETRSVSGVVRDATSGAPIANAEVGAGWTLQAAVRTNERGEYVLHASPAWLYEVSARAPGYGFKQLPYSRVAAATPLEGRLDFELVPSRRCKGIVLARSGQPLEGVYVAACASQYDEVQSIDWRSTTSRADGRFEISELRGDLPHTLFLRKEGFGTLLYEFPADEAQLTLIDLGETRMDPALTLAGRVVDDADVALPGLEITLQGHNSDRGRWQESAREWLASYVEERDARSDHEGRFAFGELAAGSYEVRARAQGHNEPVRATVVLAPGRPVTDVKLVVPRGLPIAGVIEDREHRGVPFTYVSIEPESPGGADLDVPTDEQGRFRAEGVPPGSYTLKIWPYANTREKPKDRFLSPKVVRGVQAGSSALTITLEEGAWVRGRVLDARGEPAPNVTLNALDPQGQAFAGTVSGEDGRFQFGVERDQRFTLSVRPSRPSTAYQVGWEPDPDDSHGLRIADAVGGGEEMQLRLPPK